MVCGGQTPPEQKWKTTLSSPPSSSYPPPPKHTHPSSIHSSGRLVRHQILTALLGYPQWRQDRWNNLCSFSPLRFHLAKLLSLYCGFDPGVTQISRYSVKLTTSLKLKLLPCSTIFLLSTRCSFHLSTFFHFLAGEILFGPNVLFPISLFFPNHLFAILCHLPVFQKFQSTFSTFPMIFSSKIGKMASSSRTSSNTTPQSNSSLTFLK